MSAAWGAQDVRDWLRPAFEWLTGTWSGDPTRTWAELAPEFLATLGLQEHTEFSVVHRLFDWVAALSDENERQTLLADADARGAVVEELIVAWAAERVPVDTAAAAEPEPYWDGVRWLMWDTVSLHWKPMAADEAPVDTG
jgi:hypothetical protein